ncbi:MAG: exodeoxyribonuclease VII large subunit [Chloroflexota bacterium]|nr:exodeoxyribonuclease VII large subunit [Chloroflexota bacterium]
MQLLSVTQLNQYLGELFASDPILADLWVEGEISNYVQSSRGHVYFTVKDDGAQMPCALWRSYLGRVKTPLANGQSVLVHGRVSLWQDSGKLQMYVDMVQPVGVGRLALERELLWARLESEGLFDASRKRPLPLFPAAIGIVTSMNSAALQDILAVLNRRFPLAEVVLSHTAVQGREAAPQVALAIERLYRQTEVDVIIVARGGGSTEEQEVFNEECIARAIYGSPVPVVTGIGHQARRSADVADAEVFKTTADLVADVWAATPSAAAELATPDIRELRRSVLGMRSYLSSRLRDVLSSQRSDVRHLKSHLARVSPALTVARYRESLQTASDAATLRLEHTVERLRGQVDGQTAKLQALDPLSVLRRGYAVVARADGTPVTSAKGVLDGEPLLTRFRDGQVRSTVISVERSDKDVA